MKLLKKISLFTFVGVIGFAATSCLNNDDNDYTQFGLLETTSINYNKDSIKPVGQTTKIMVTYKKTNTCQKFIQFSNLGSSDYKHNIGVYASQSTGNNCTSEETLETETLKFTPTTEGEYTLRFWKGNKANSNVAIYDSIVLNIKK
jgi:hypothetical protein